MGHDLATLALDAARGDESYPLLRGDPQTLKAGDMYIRDGEGVISSIIYGPDRRTQLTPETRGVVFTVYAPAGMETEAVEVHLCAPEDNVGVISPGAETVVRAVLGANAAGRSPHAGSR